MIKLYNPLYVYDYSTGHVMFITMLLIIMHFSLIGRYLLPRVLSKCVAMSSSFKSNNESSPFLFLFQKIKYLRKDPQILYKLYKHLFY